MKVAAPTVAALVFCLGWARPSAPAPVEPVASDVVPAIDRFDVPMAEATVVRARLIAIDGACDKYCWAKVHVEDVVIGAPQDQLGDIRVAYRSGGPGVAPGTSTLYLAPYNKDSPATNLWRLVTDRARPTPPTVSQVAASWAHAFRKGDRVWLAEMTALPFSFRRVDVSAPPKPSDVSAEPACPTALASAAGLAPWLDCLHHASADETLALTLAFASPETAPGVAGAPARLRRAAQSAGGGNDWAHVWGEVYGVRYDVLLALIPGPAGPRVSIGLLELTLSAHGRRARERRMSYRAFTSAIARNDVAAVKGLLRAGVSANEVGSDEGPGSPPIALAADQGRLEIIDVLLAAGARPNACCCSCVTALHRAILKRHADVVARLLRSKADPDILYEGRQSTLDLARQVGDPQIIRLLEDRAKAP